VEKLFFTNIELEYSKILMKGQKRILRGLIKEFILIIILLSLRSYPKSDLVIIVIKREENRVKARVQGYRDPSPDRADYPGFFESDPYLADPRPCRNP